MRRRKISIPYYAPIPLHERRPRGVCGKICFEKKDAQTKANWLEKKGNARRLRVYHCEDCEAWHMTKT